MVDMLLLKKIAHNVYIELLDEFGTIRNMCHNAAAKVVQKLNEHGLKGVIVVFYVFPKKENSKHKIAISHVLTITKYDDKFYVFDPTIKQFYPEDDDLVYPIDVLFSKYKVLGFKTPAPYILRNFYGITYSKDYESLENEIIWYLIYKKGLRFLEK